MGGGGGGVIVLFVFENMTIINFVIGICAKNHFLYMKGCTVLPSYNVIAAFSNNPLKGCFSKFYVENVPLTRINVAFTSFDDHFLCIFIKFIH